MAFKEYEVSFLTSKKKYSTEISKYSLRENLKIKYLDNLAKNIDDLKLYFCDLYKYKFCPCKLKISSNKYVSSYAYEFKLEKEENKLLSDLENNFIYVIEFPDLECKCNKNQKKYSIKSKFELINDIIEKDEKILELKERLINIQTNENYFASKKIEKQNEKIKFENKINELKSKNLELIKNNLEIEKEKNKFMDENKNYKIELDNLNNNLESTKIKFNEAIKENEKYKADKNSLLTDNTNYKKIINEQKREIDKLQINQNNNKNIINNLENSLKTEKQNFSKTKNDLNKINSEKFNLEHNLKEKEKIINDIKNNNNELEIKVNDLEKEKKDLKFALLSNPNKLNLLHEMGYFLDIKKKDNSTIINVINNKIMPNDHQNSKVEFKNFYDIIINISSVKDVSKGWKIEMTKEGEENYFKFIKKDLLKIGVIGNSNKGKSFILERLSKIPFPSSFYINTRGLSIKYPELKGHEDRNYVLLDSAGLETPVLNFDNNEINDDIIIDKENNIKSNENENSENKENNKINNNEDKKESKEQIGNLLEKDNQTNYFIEKSRDKLITESFLQNYIIFNSDILIIVVGILTYSEQKLINKIKNAIKSSKKKII